MLRQPEIIRAAEARTGYGVPRFLVTLLFDIEPPSLPMCHSVTVAALWRSVQEWDREQFLACWLNARHYIIAVNMVSWPDSRSRFSLHAKHHECPNISPRIVTESVRRLHRSIVRQRNSFVRISSSRYMPGRFPAPSPCSASSVSRIRRP